MSSQPVTSAAARFFRSFFALSSSHTTPTCRHHSRSLHCAVRNRPVLCQTHRPARHVYPSSHRRQQHQSAAPLSSSPQTSASNTQRHSPARSTTPQSNAAHTPTPTPPPAPDAPPEETLATHLRSLMRLVPHPVTLITATASSTSTSSSTSPNTPSSSLAQEHLFRGATVSSFNSVTLAPRPLVSLNMRLPSSTHTALTSTGTFLAHILAANASGARIAAAFAKPGGAEGAFATLAGVSRGASRGNGDEGEQGGERESSREAKAEIQVFTGPSTGNAPLLGATEGVLRVLRCKVLEGKEVRVGDHVVLVAEVVGILDAPAAPPVSSSRAGSEGEVMSGLNYMRGRGRGDGVGEGGSGREGRSQRHGLVYMDRGYRSVDSTVDLIEQKEEAVEKDLSSHASTSRDTTTSEQIHRTIGLNVRRGDEYDR